MSGGGAPVMRVPATWGLGSLQFLILYGSLCALLRAANILAWSAVERTAPVSHDTPVDAYELAMVNGGPRQAITTALTMLTWRGVARAEGPDGTLHVEGDMSADAHPPRRAVYEDVRRHGLLHAAALRHEPATSETLEHVRTTLTAKGLLIDPRYTAWTGRLWLWGPVVLFVLGAGRLLAMWQYIDADTNMRLLLFTTLGVGIVALSHAHDQRRYDGRPLPSERGRSLVEQWRSKDRAAIEAEDARVAFATALADQEDWDPSRVPTRRRASERGRLASRGGCVHRGSRSIYDVVAIAHDVRRLDREAPISFLSTPRTLRGRLWEEVPARGWRSAARASIIGVLSAPAETAPTGSR